MLQCVLPHIGQKRGIDKYDWEVLQSFSPVLYVFIEICDDFYCFGVSRFRFSFFSEPKNENMLKCVLPHIWQKRGIDKYNWEVLQSFVSVPYVFIEIEWLLLFWGLAFLVLCFLEPSQSRITKTCQSVYYHTQGRKGVSTNTIGRYCRVLSQFRMFY